MGAGSVVPDVVGGSGGWLCSALVLRRACSDGGHGRGAWRRGRCVGVVCGQRVGRADASPRRDPLSGHVAEVSGALDPFTTVSPTVAPSVSGTAEIGLALTADPGTWPGSPLGFSYQWLDCDPTDSGSCVAISNATSSTYTVAPTDAGEEIEVQVSADYGEDPGGIAASAPTAAVVAQPGAPMLQTPPSVGTVDGGMPVSATPGTWTGDPYAFPTTGTPARRI